ncbi:MAG: zf-TFIIB domain-containing protein [Phormidesmis sp.]
MRCPKETTVEMEAGALAEDLPVQCCPECDGNWLPAQNYRRWQALNAGLEAIPEKVLPLTLETDYKPAPLDGRAGLCPECGTYLKRSRLNLKTGSFYVERCPLCEGFWCDKGEWQIFEALGLHVQIPIVFQPEWQASVRELEKVEKQRLALIEKLGPEISERILELADLLKGHPHGDFGVGYLMRKLGE